jgi:hypothetical protein
MWLRIETRGLQIIAVTALQVAGWTDWFGHDNERFASRCRCPWGFHWYFAYLSRETQVPNMISI